MTERLPTIFFGHGNPMNALHANHWTRGWAAIGQQLPRPRAVLSVSAHWYLPGTAVTTMASPRTIHDFGGFPRELFEVQYPAPGNVQLARRVDELLKPLDVRGDEAWGLDHGTWSVLRHVFPDADVPVVQLSIDESQPPAFHYELGRLLRPLRDEGILIIDSGDVVHNLHSYAWGRHPA
ncbi:MAG: 4,5-DOPA dioxygenase extradiol, partial [Dokdonella sp.]